MADVGHGATFGGHVAQVDLLGLDLDLRAAAERTDSPLNVLSELHTTDMKRSKSCGWCDRFGERGGAENGHFSCEVSQRGSADKDGWVQTGGCQLPGERLT